jgi:hypothetical protein
LSSAEKVDDEYLPSCSDGDEPEENSASESYTSEEEEEEEEEESKVSSVSSEDDEEAGATKAEEVRVKAKKRVRLHRKISHKVISDSDNEGGEEGEKIPKTAAAGKERNEKRKRSSLPQKLLPLKKRKIVEEKNRKSDDSKKDGKVEKTVTVKKNAVEIVPSPSAKVRDVSRPCMNLIKDKFILGERYFVQMAQVNVQAKNFTFHSLCMGRDAADNSDGKKPFTFNLPAKLIIPLRDAINEIAKNIDEKMLI